MIATSVAGFILTGCTFFSQGVAPGEPSISETEKGWYDQHQKTLEITIRLQRGKIIFIAKDIKDRKLMQPVVMKYDDNQKLESILWAKEAQIRYDAKQNAVLLEIRECEFRVVSNGAHGLMESSSMSLPLAATK
jgi:hypothetical protein